MIIHVLEKRRKNDILGVSNFYKSEYNFSDLISRANNSDREAINTLEDLYYEGLYIPRENDKIFFNLMPYCKIGLSYFIGDGVKKDLGRAGWWLKKACEYYRSGDGESPYYLGEIYLLARNKPKNVFLLRDDEIFKDFYKAFHWLAGRASSYYLKRDKFLWEAAKNYNFDYFVKKVQNYAPAKEIYELGKKYMEEENFEKGFYYLRCAADQMNDDAIIELSEIYYNRYDEKIAFQYLEKVTDTDKLNFEYVKNIADHFFQGRGIRCVGKNIDKAIYWYKKLADAGNVEAMYKLGEIYRYGQGVEKNLSAAIKWLDMAYKKIKK